MTSLQAMWLLVFIILGTPLTWFYAIPAIHKLIAWYRLTVKKRDAEQAAAAKQSYAQQARDRFKHLNHTHPTNSTFATTVDISNMSANWNSLIWYDQIRQQVEFVDAILKRQAKQKLKDKK